MNETTFISRNKDKWRELEQLLDSKIKDPDKLQELFVKVSGDLSYARTYYANRSVRLYLNNLTQRVLDLIQTRKNRFSIADVQYFYRHTLPISLWKARYYLLISLLIFVISVAIGALSTANNIDFARVILSDEYIEMTNKNINDGDPMAVYKSANQVSMFSMITFNNMFVAFLAFILGLFGSIGTVIIMLQNGIMLGAFQYFFYQKGLFMTSFLTIWIHGTIEISAIIIAGAAGLILGDGILNPKTYNRSISLQMSARRALRILLSTMPLFIIAGFLESFVTRLTELPIFFKAAIILLSLAFIIYHFIIYPYNYQQKHIIPEDDDHIIPADLESVIKGKNRYRSFGEILELTFAQFRIHVGTILQNGIFPIFIIAVTSFWFFGKYQELVDSSVIDEYGNLLMFNFERGGLVLLTVYILILVHLVSIISMTYHQIEITVNKYLLHLIKHGALIVFLVTPLLTIFYLTDTEILLIFLLFVPPQIFFTMLNSSIGQDKSIIKSLGDGFKVGYKNYTNHLRVFVLITFTYYLLKLGISTLISLFYANFIDWHDFFPGSVSTSIYSESLANILLSGFMLILYYFMYSNLLQSLICKDESFDLFERIKNFGTKNSLS